MPVTASADVGGGGLFYREGCGAQILRYAVLNLHMDVCLFNTLLLRENSLSVIGAAQKNVNLRSVTAILSGVVSLRGVP